MLNLNHGVAPALVLELDDDSVSLWDPAVNGLVEELEDRLDGVFVTFATRGSGSPSLDDALAAARFAGCSSAVLVAPEGSRAKALQRLSAKVSVPLVEVGSEWTEEAIAEAYQQHRERALRRQDAA